MSKNFLEKDQKMVKMYRDIEMSERQIKQGRVKDARKALLNLKKRYEL